MMVGNQVIVKNAESEYFGRAGVVLALVGRDDDETATVRLDESQSHEAVDVKIVCTDLRML